MVIYCNKKYTFRENPKYFSIFVKALRFLTVFAFKTFSPTSKSERYQKTTFQKNCRGERKEQYSKGFTKLVIRAKSKRRKNGHISKLWYILLLLLQRSTTVIYSNLDSILFKLVKTISQKQERKLSYSKEHAIFATKKVKAVYVSKREIIISYTEVVVEGIVDTTIAAHHHLVQGPRVTAWSRVIRLPPLEPGMSCLGFLR